jgi:hypothetical protein
MPQPSATPARGPSALPAPVCQESGCRGAPKSRQRRPSPATVTPGRPWSSQGRAGSPAAASLAIDSRPGAQKVLRCQAHADGGWWAAWDRAPSAAGAWDARPLAHTGHQGGVREADKRFGFGGALAMRRDELGWLRLCRHASAGPGDDPQAGGTLPQRLLLLLIAHTLLYRYLFLSQERCHLPATRACGDVPLALMAGGGQAPVQVVGCTNQGQVSEGLGKVPQVFAT